MTDLHVVSKEEGQQDAGKKTTRTLNAMYNLFPQSYDRL